MHRSLGLALALCTAVAACSKPTPPDTERRPEPQATELRDAMQAAQKKAAAAQRAAEQAQRDRDAALDAAGG